MFLLTSEYLVSSSSFEIKVTANDHDCVPYLLHRLSTWFLWKEEMCKVLFRMRCIIGVAPITQYAHERNTNSSIQGRSHGVVKVISIPKGTALKGKNSLPLGENSFQFIA